MCFDWLIICVDIHIFFFIIIFFFYQNIPINFMALINLFGTFYLYVDDSFGRLKNIFEWLS